MFAAREAIKEERDVDAIAQGLTQVFLAGQLPVMEPGGEELP